jgi:large repetitive protein
VTRSLLALAVLGLVCVFASPAAAVTTFTVTTTADSNDGVCTPTLCSLRDAVIAANADPDASTINLPAGHYTLGGASGEEAGATGDLDVTAPLSVVGAGAASTIVDGAHNDRLFDAHGITVPLSLAAMTLTAGKENVGSAVRVEGDVTLTGMSITGNGGPTSTLGVVSSEGGGSATYTITDTSISSNQVAGSNGGGIGVLFVQNSGAATVNMTNSTVVSNTVGGGGPMGTGYGPIFIQNGGASDVTLTGSRVAGNNIGESGGALASP